jgi:peptide/nickel transport system substrate-binding protein
MKKLFVFLVILIVCATLVIGCGTPAPTPTTPTTPTSPATPTTPTTPATPTTPTTPATPSTPSPAKPAPVTPTTPSKPTATTGPVYGGTLRYIFPSPPGSPLGAYWETSQGIPATQLCLEPMMFEQADASFEPAMAESFDIDAGNDTPGIIFHIRKGVKLHDGSTLDANLVKWNFEMVRDGKLFGGTRYFKKLEVIDDYTLRVYTTMHRNSIINMFAKNQHYIASKAAFDKNGLEWMRWHMVGTGPFKQVEFVRDVSLKTVRNDDYWQAGKPYLFGVDYLFVTDEMTRIALFKSGGADIINMAGNGRLARDLEKEGYQIITYPAGTDILIPDNKNPDSPWFNLKVREAAEYAIDKEAIANAFGYGFRQAAYQLAPPDNPTNSPNIAPRKYDPAKAKQLLAEAGYPNGFKSKIIAQNTVNHDIIVALQSQFGQVGIDMDLDFVEPAKYMNYFVGTWDNGLVYNTLSMGANPNPTIGFFFPEPRIFFKSNKNPEGWGDQYTTIMTTPKPEPREQQKGWELVASELTIIPINHYDDMHVVSSKVHDTGLGTRDSSTSWNPQDAWLSK